jgi:hypothetical protein
MVAAILNLSHAEVYVADALGSPQQMDVFSSGFETRELLIDRRGSGERR